MADLRPPDTMTPESSSPTSILPLLFLAFFVITLSTRFVTGLFARDGSSKSSHANPPPLLPYWIPIVGHLFEFLFNNERFLRGARDTYPQGIFALNLLGTRHNFVYGPSFIKTILTQNNPVAEHESIFWIVRQNFFGIPSDPKDRFRDALPEVHSIFARHFLREPYLGEMIGTVVRNLEEMLPNLVSFMDSIVDQAPWERVSNVKVVQKADGKPAVEASLLPLVRDLLGFAANPAFVGTTLLENYPNFHSDLWIYDSAFFLMAAGLPRWFPIPRLTAGHIARRRLIQKLTAYHQALDAVSKGDDPGPEWRDLSDVSPALLAGQKNFADHGIPLEVRAASDLGLIWAMNANANVLVFWMLVRILSVPGLVDRIRAETAPYARATQPEQLLGMPESPRLKLDIDGLCDSCPLLRSCYMETLRLDSTPFSIKKMQQDLVISESAEDAAGGMPATFLLRKGEYVDMPYMLHHTDETYFPDPLKWVPDRHVRPAEKEGGVSTAEWGTLWPYGGGRSMCKGRLFAEKELLAFVAGFLALWELEPVDRKGWRISRHGKASAVAAPKDDVRVRIRRRVLS